MKNREQKAFSYVVKPSSYLSFDVLREIFFFRRLIWIFIWRDIRVRYQNTLIGGAWYLLQPFAMMIIFTIFFRAAFKDFIGNIPYPLFAYSGLVVWQMFSRALSLGSGSIIMFESILNKIYFPRLIAPLSMVVGTVFDFIVASSIIFLMMLYYDISPKWNVVFVPALVFVMVLLATGVGCVLAAADVRFRDVRHTIPLLIQVWMFSTPIMYPSSYLGTRWMWLYELNPMVGIAEWFRWLVFGVGNEPSVSSLMLSVGIALLSFGVGIFFFQKVQNTAVDTL